MSMWFIVKRLLLGLVLILLASAVLLISDWRRRDSSAGRAGVNRKWVVNLLEYVNVADSEESEKGIVDGLREAGLVEGRDFEMTIRNAQGDMSTLNALGRCRADRQGRSAHDAFDADTAGGHTQGPEVAHRFHLSG